MRSETWRKGFDTILAGSVVPVRTRDGKNLSYWMENAAYLLESILLTAAISPGSEIASRTLQRLLHQLLGILSWIQVVFLDD